MKNIYLYKNLNKKNYIILDDIDWGRKQSKFYSKLHNISSYLAMFAPSLPSYFIQKYSNKYDWIMDNFSGRGTTSLVARELDRNFIGTDLNPYSYVLTKAKQSTSSKDQIIKRILFLKNNFYNNHEKYRSKFLQIDPILKYYYSDETLYQLLYLREKIGKYWKKNNDINNLILAFAIGIMHGPMKKNKKDTIYYSLSMSNAISMSPNYVKNYSIKHNLIKPNVDVFQKIIDRVNSKYDDILLKICKSKMYLHDATIECKKIYNNSISLVITSPPYMNIVNYTSSNWLKLWLLGFEKNELSNIKLSNKHNFKNYVLFIKKYLNAIYKKLKSGAKVCLVVGDIHDNELIENVWQQIKNDVKYKFVEIYYDYNYKQNNKVTNMLNKKKSQATKIEKVLVIEKM